MLQHFIILYPFEHIIYVRKFGMIQRILNLINEVQGNLFGIRIVGEDGRESEGEREGIDKVARNNQKCNSVNA